MTRACVLIDACAIIDICEVGWWDRIVRACELVVPSYVVEEADYYVGPEGWREVIDLDSYVCGGKVAMLRAAPDEMLTLRDVFTRTKLEAIDPGEAEALALIHVGQADGHLYCSTDGHAIECLALMGKSEVGVSLQALLSRLGYTLPQGAPRKCCQDFFDYHLRMGREQRIRCQGIVQPPI